MSAPRGFRITSGKGFHITFENGWTVSVQFGPGSYCDNYDAPYGAVPPKSGWASSNAEVAAWPPGGTLIDMDGDTVAPRLTPKEVLAILNDIAARP